MRQFFHTFLLLTLVLNTMPAHAFFPGLLGGKTSTPAPGYLASNKKFTPCSINFVSLLNGKIPAEVFGANKTNLWSDSFSARNYLDELMASPEFAEAGKRTKFLEDLGKFVHKDEVYLKNISDLATLMKNEDLVSMADLRKAFLGREFAHAKFIYSQPQKKILASLDIDPAKASLIERAVSSSELGEGLAKEYRQILRSSSLGAEDIEYALDKGMTLRKSVEELERFRHYIEFLDKYSGQKLGKIKIRSGLKNIEKIYDEFDPKWFEVDRWFRPHKKFLANTPENLNREAAIKNVVESFDLPKDARREYIEAFRKSGLTQEQIELAKNSGMVLRSDTRSIERFKEYLVYLDYLPSYKVAKGLKKVEQIYKYADDTRFFIPAGVLPPHKQFIAQRAKVLKYENKRSQTLLREFKMEEREKLMKDLDELLAARARGEAIDEGQIAAIRKEVDSVSLSPALIQRARNRARGEAGIFRKLINGCNGGGSAQLASAAKKFARFKLALSIGGTPYFYLTRNWDKKDSDPYFWERLGHEMASGLFFTLVANKIITNTNKNFWARYLEGYIKFGAVDMLSSGTYDALFGKHSYIRYFQQFYNGGEMPQSMVEEEFEKLKNSPNFEEDFEALMAYMEEMAQKKNVKNWLAERFDLSAYSSLEDEFKITQEDLETEEAREVMMEILAEKMYLASMGDWPLFQTGNTGADRWAFYRAQNSIMDMKSMALNIAIFEIMCREPLGKIGSWGLVLGLTVGNWMISGKLSSNWRREAINQ